MALSSATSKSEIREFGIIVFEGWDRLLDQTRRVAYIAS